MHPQGEQLLSGVISPQPPGVAAALNIGNGSHHSSVRGSRKDNIWRKGFNSKSYTSLKRHLANFVPKGSAGLPYVRTDAQQCGTGTLLSSFTQTETMQKTNFHCQDHAWARALKEIQIKTITQMSLMRKQHRIGNQKTFLKKIKNSKLFICIILLVFNIL